MGPFPLNVPERLVIIPTYDERENIETVLGRVFALDPPFDVLVVDDGSPDGTAGIVKDLQAHWPGRLHLLERQGKQGLGTAYIAGFKWALQREYAFIFEMDADLSHDPDDLLRLVAAEPDICRVPIMIDSSKWSVIEAGLKNVQLNLYPEARHELLNETNRAEVTAEVLSWLDARLEHQRACSPKEMA